MTQRVSYERESELEMSADTQGRRRGGVKLSQRALDCFFLLRIPLLAPVWTILLLGWITGNASACIGGWVFGGCQTAGDERVLWLSLFAFSLIVASIYVVNQIVDIESDRINHKLFLLPRGIVSIRAAWVLAVFCMLTGLAIAIVMLDWFMTALFALSLVMGALYNLPPASLKDHAWGGMVANFIGHGILTFLVGWHAARFTSPLGLEQSGAALLASLSPGLANAAVYITTTIADCTGDARTGKKTFCVLYGERRTALCATVLCAGALMFSFALPHNAWVMAVPAAMSTVLFGYLAAVPRRANAFRAFKWPVFILTAMTSLFVPVYGVLIVATFLFSRLYYRTRFGIEYPTFKSQ
jgi:4-hydroxybenzoate polyprenyltransferase